MKSKENKPVKNGRTVDPFPRPKTFLELVHVERSNGGKQTQVSYLHDLQKYLAIETQTDGHIEFYAKKNDTPHLHYYYIYQLLSFQTKTEKDLTQCITNLNELKRINSNASSLAQQISVQSFKALKLLNEVEPQIAGVAFELENIQQLLCVIRTKRSHESSFLYTVYRYVQNFQRNFLERFYGLWKTLADIVVRTQLNINFPNSKNIDALNYLTNLENKISMMQGYFKELSEQIKPDLSSIFNLEFYLAQYAQTLKIMEPMKAKEDSEIIKIKMCTALVADLMGRNLQDYFCPVTNMAASSRMKQLSLFTQKLVMNPKIKSTILKRIYQLTEEIFQRVIAWPENSSIREYNQQRDMVLSLKRINMQLKVLQISKNALLKGNTLFSHGAIRSMVPQQIEICEKGKINHENLAIKLDLVISFINEKISDLSASTFKLTPRKRDFLKIEKEYFKALWLELAKTDKRAAEGLINIFVQVLQRQYENHDPKFMKFYHEILATQKFFMCHYMDNNEIISQLKNGFEDLDKIRKKLGKIFLEFAEIQEVKLQFNYYLSILLKNEYIFYAALIKCCLGAREKTEKFFGPKVMEYSFLSLYPEIALQVKKIKCLKELRDALQQDSVEVINLNFDVVEQENIFSKDFFKIVLNQYAKYRFSFGAEITEIQNSNLLSERLAAKIIEERQNSVDSITLEDLEDRVMQNLNDARKGLI